MPRGVFGVYILRLMRQAFEICFAFYGTNFLYIPYIPLQNVFLVCLAVSKYQKLVNQSKHVLVSCNIICHSRLLSELVFSIMSCWGFYQLYDGFRFAFFFFYEEKGITFFSFIQLLRLTWFLLHPIILAFKTIFSLQI